MKALTLVVALFALGCSGSHSPVAPSTPSTVTVSGVVRGDDGLVVSSATLTVLDSVNAGKATTSRSDGTYTFAALQPANMNFRIDAPGYSTSIKGVSAFADTVLSVDLVRLPRAQLRAIEDTIHGTLQPDGQYTFSASGQNVGTGCAQNVAGTFTLAKDGTNLLSVDWSLPASTIVRPGETFTFTVADIPRDIAFSGATYSVRFTFVTVAC
jgi:carboxypeptidase family protein